MTSGASTSAGRSADGGNKKIAVSLRGLWKTYSGNSHPAVKNLSIDIHDGEILTLFGPSGCGKTTTLRMVAGLETPDAGDILFGDQTIVMTLFIGERIEYQVKVDGQSTVVIYGERHRPVDEGSRVWLKLRPDGHSAWSSDWSHTEE